MMRLMLAAAACWAALAGAAHAAERPVRYPDKPIRFLVGFSTGGVNDIVSRILAHELSRSAGQQVIVDNRAGANGIIANGIAAAAAPDGYTMLLVPSSFAIDIARRAKLPYDGEKDFTPVTQVASGPLVLVVHHALAAGTVRELIDLLRAKPGQLSYGHAGNGNLTHIAVEMFKSMTGTEAIAVAYKGGGASLTDIAAGQVQFGIPTLPPAMVHIRAGRVRPLGVTSPRRSAVLPDVPTIAEAGVPGYEATAWWGVLVPARTPKAVVEALRDHIARALQQPDVRQRLGALGAEGVGSTPAEFGRYLREESGRWRKVIQSAGLTLS